MIDLQELERRFDEWFENATTDSLLQSLYEVRFRNMRQRLGTGVFDRLDSVSEEIQNPQREASLVLDGISWEDVIKHSTKGAETISMTVPVREQFNFENKQKENYPKGRSFALAA